MAVTVNAVLARKVKLETQLLRELQAFEGATLCSVRSIELEKMYSAKNVETTAKATLLIDFPDRPRKELERD